jgi:uncharacterized protein YkwD
VKVSINILILASLFTVHFGLGNPHNGPEEIKPNIFNEKINVKAIDHNLIELGVSYLTNIYRKKKGKSALSYNACLSDAAYIHSQQMQSFHFFAHNNKRNKSLETIDKRAAVAGYDSFITLAENIYFGAIDTQDPPSYYELCNAIANAFIQSKRHRSNLLAADVEDIGCGVYFEDSLENTYWYFYFTQDFGKQQ